METNKNLERRLISLVRSDDHIMDLLKAVSSLHLPDWYVGAGTVRNLVWNHLEGGEPVKPNDIDVIYFEPEDASEDREKELEKVLQDLMPGLPWSVKNQARMASVNGDAPYMSSADAIAHWPETVTCIGVRIEGDDIIVCAPYGLDDLFAERVRVSPGYSGLLRDKARRWRELWPHINYE